MRAKTTSGREREVRGSETHSPNQDLMGQVNVEVHIAKRFGRHHASQRHQHARHGHPPQPVNEAQTFAGPLAAHDHHHGGDEPHVMERRLHTAEMRGAHTTAHTKKRTAISTYDVCGHATYDAVPKGNEPVSR